jgi:hypothetical protein
MAGSYLGLAMGGANLRGGADFLGTVPVELSILSAD